VSNVHRLRLTDRIFFVNVNLRPRIGRFNASEYALLIDVLEASRRRLGFLLCGYVLMPDHWHALIWPQYPNLARRGGSRTALAQMRAIVDEGGSRTAPTTRPARQPGTVVATSVLGSLRA
jgi:REP element-mobilizing transposase RayT